MLDDASHRYVMLMASLPYQATLFGAKQTPLSRLQLDRRLAMLSEEDAARLTLIEDLVTWSGHPLGETDGEILGRADAVLAKLDDPVLARLVESRLELRTIVAALRRRRRGQPPPGPRERWGWGRWAGWIARTWAEPDFRLSRTHPWVPEADRLLAEGDAYGLERLLLGQVWTELGRIGEGHIFDFPAVVVYVLRWDLIARWTGQDGTAAAARFDRLTDQGLAGFAHLFPNPA